MRAACLVLLTLNACAGISFGDDESAEGPPATCTQRDQAVADLTEIPTGFSEAPETTLAPADGPYSGTLTLASTGEVVPIAVTFALNRQTTRARSWASITGQRCMPPALDANLQLTIEAGATLSGVVGGEVTTEGGGLFISASVGAEASITTTLMPSFSSAPLHPPTLSTPMSYLDGVWSGPWEWSASVDCSNTQLCSGFEVVPLGNVLLNRN